MKKHTRYSHLNDLNLVNRRERGLPGITKKGFPSKEIVLMLSFDKSAAPYTLSVAKTWCVGYGSVIIRSGNLSRLK